MVYLQGMSHQFEINVIKAFYQINLEITQVNLLNDLLVINIYCFFFFIYSMIMVRGYCSWNIFDDLFKCLRFLKGCFHAFLQFPSHIQENLEKKKIHTLSCFSLKSHGQSFFLNLLFLQFNSRINRGFYFCKQSPFEEICGILLCKNEFCNKIYLPKYIFHKNLFL